jgi:hypothetical protein
VKHPLRRACASAAALVAAMIVAPGSASATNTIDCQAKSARAADDVTALDYQFRCSEAITGYSLVTNRLTAGFEPEVLVTIGTTEDPAQGESFGCEGAIPGFGAACVGKASAWNYAHGRINTDAPVCSAKEGPLVVRLVVTDFDKRISQPFGVRTPKCPKPKPKPHTKHKKHNHAARHH